MKLHTIKNITDQAEASNIARHLTMEIMNCFVALFIGGTLWQDIPSQWSEPKGTVHFERNENNDPRHRVTVSGMLREVLGEEGTVLFPVLTFPYVFIGEPNRNPMYRPYDPADLSRIWTGAMPRFVLAKCPDAVRSRHVSHAWCGFGKLAAEACAAHQPTEAPMSDNSPLAYALKAKGKIVHFGNTIGSTTFLHFLEDKLDLPGLDTVLIKIKKSNGYSYCASIPRNLPADRDFYHGTQDDSRFFKAAVAKGLKITSTSLGIGQVLAMDMEELYNIGCDLLTADPNLLLLRETETDLSGIRWQKINEKE